MKRTFIIAGGFLAVLVLLLAGLVAFLDQVVVKTVNTAGPAALGVPVRLEEARIRPFRGRTTLRGLHVGNPEGYKTDGLLDLGSIVVKFDRSTLLADVVRIREIAIDGLVVTYEKGLLNSNLGALIDQLSAGAEGEEPAQEKPAAEEAPGKKVVIEKLTITGSKMNFSVTGAAALTGGGAVPLPLPPITLTGLGREKDGVTFVEAIQHVLKAIAGATGTAIVGASHLIGDAGKAVGTGALAVGEGAVDAGKAVVSGTVDAGKAVVDGAAGALQAVNPFSKKE